MATFKKIIRYEMPEHEQGEEIFVNVDQILYYQEKTTPVAHQVLVLPTRSIITKGFSLK